MVSWYHLIITKNLKFSVQGTEVIKAVNKTILTSLL